MVDVSEYGKPAIDMAAEFITDQCMQTNSGMDAKMADVLVASCLIAQGYERMKAASDVTEARKFLQSLINLDDDDTSGANVEFAEPPRRH